jgi:hypothetical protein
MICEGERHARLDAGAVRIAMARAHRKANRAAELIMLIAWRVGSRAHGQAAKGEGELAPHQGAR